ncbi:MAG: DUF2079 domain-containing protein [Leptolyngbya sp. BL-A-14]
MIGSALHSYFQWLSAQRSHLVKKDWSELKALLLLTVIFYSTVLALSLHRYYSFYASYDHGLFNQIFLNNLHGRFFQSSLSGANAFSALAGEKVPSVAAVHFGQHFVPDFLLWLPFYAFFPAPVTLVVLQVSLMTAGGLVLYPLARHYLQPSLSLLITASYYSAGAVIGPTFADFYEQCQIPLLTFGCLLAMEKRRWGLFWFLAVLVLGIREDAGLILFSIGLYLVISRRYPLVGGALCLLSFGYVVVVTNLIMPLFSDDSSKLYLANRFRAFVENDPNPSTLRVLLGMLTHPIALLLSLFTPLDSRLFYLFKQWLPLAFVPAVSGAAWLLIGVPLLSLLAQSSHWVATVTIRYAIAVVPGLFYGAILWWFHHADRWRPSFRRFWVGCLSLSLVLVVADNPNRAFYFLVPDGFLAQFSVPLVRQWEHAQHLWRVVHVIPPEASVSATSDLLPQLSKRRFLLNLPFMQLQNDQGQVVSVEYVAADLWQLQRPKALPAFERNHLSAALMLCDRVLAEATYGFLLVEDGVVLMQRGVTSPPAALEAWETLRQSLKTA